MNKGQTLKARCSDCGKECAGHTYEIAGKQLVLCSICRRDRRV